ncbi:MAG: hypothetical protein ABIA59_06265 [Candidatus Latescibacterota bacterium]
MSYNIKDIEGNEPAYAEKLASVKIMTTDDLLEQSPSQVDEWIEQAKQLDANLSC